MFRFIIGLIVIGIFIGYYLARHPDVVEETKAQVSEQVKDGLDEAVEDAKERLP